MKFKILIFAQLFGLSAGAIAQISTVPQLEKQLKVGIDKAYAASVRIWGYDTVRKSQNSSQFSGVVVSKDGTILTVSHAIEPNRTYKVRFPDGRETMAVALGKVAISDQQSRPDLGMMQLTAPGDWPVAEMGWSASLKINEPCFGISYPETLNQLLPTVRFGRISQIIDEFGFVHSSSKMEPGDSGGPLFDYMGRVIGIHSRCLQAEDGNFEVPIDTYRKYWTALKLAKDYKSLPADTDQFGLDPLKGKLLSAAYLADLSTKLPASISRFSSSVVRIYNRSKKDSTVVLATVIDIDSKTYLISKSSMVLADFWCDETGKNNNLSIVSRDAENDLVLIAVEKKVKTLVPLILSREKSTLITKDLGTFLISPVPNGNKTSVLSSMYFELPKKFSVGYFGANSTYSSGKIMLTRLSATSPAKAAGLQIGDQITELNGFKVNSASDYNQEMFKYNPGDSINITGIRNEEPLKVNVKLTQRPRSSHAADNFDGGKSIRLDGFKSVFAHDAILQPEQCGGPVLDLDGNFYGINIARFSRTSCIAVPIAILSEFIEKSISKDRI